MPEGDRPGTLLAGGAFYSPVKASLCSNDVLLSELQQPRPRLIPRHQHELSYVTVVLNGDYREGTSGKLQELRPFTAVFNPAGMEHATEIGPAGAAFFTIELRPEPLRQLEQRLPTRTEIDSGLMLWPALRLYAAFKTGVMDALTRESLVMELLAGIRGNLHSDKSRPRWLGKVKDRMREEFGENLRMSDLAGAAGVHPVHLARTFRLYEGRTPGDYLQQLRIRAACRHLSKRDYPLSIIAAECGFADQSHFTRVFRKFLGTTPAKFRLAAS